MIAATAWNLKKMMRKLIFWGLFVQILCCTYYISKIDNAI